MRSEVFNQPPFYTIVVMWELFGENWTFLKIIIVSYSLNRFINIVDAVTFFFPTAVEVFIPNRRLKVVALRTLFFFPFYLGQAS